MKVTVTKKEPENEYPKIMEANDGEIIFFTSAGEGIVLNNTKYRIGEVSTQWAMSLLTPLPKGSKIVIEV